MPWREAWNWRCGVICVWRRRPRSSGCIAAAGVSRCEGRVGLGHSLSNRLEIPGQAPREDAFAEQRVQEVVVLPRLGTGTRAPIHLVVAPGMEQGKRIERFQTPGVRESGPRRLDAG